VKRSGHMHSTSGHCTNFITSRYVGCEHIPRWLVDLSTAVLPVRGQVPVRGPSVILDCSIVTFRKLNCSQLARTRHCVWQWWDAKSTLYWRAFMQTAKWNGNSASGDWLHRCECVCVCVC